MHCTTTDNAFYDTSNSIQEPVVYTHLIIQSPLLIVCIAPA